MGKRDTIAPASAIGARCGEQVRALILIKQRQATCTGLSIGAAVGGGVVGVSQSIGVGVGATLAPQSSLSAIAGFGSGSIVGLILAIAIIKFQIKAIQGNSNQ